jgi:hypothetical protein
MRVDGEEWQIGSQRPPADDIILRRDMGSEAKTKNEERQE